MKIDKFISVTAIAVLLVLLQSCVTTSEGGFNVLPDDERAVIDFVQLASTYYEAGDMSAAKRHVNNALAIDNEYSDVYNILALIQQFQGDIDLAEQSFERAISLDGTNSKARNNYAALLFSLGRFETASNQLEVVVRDFNYEGRAVAFENLGRSFVQLQRLAEAEAAFARALQLNPDLYLSALEMAQIKSSDEQWLSARNFYRQYLTTIQFTNFPTRLNPCGLEYKLNDNFLTLIYSMTSSYY